MPVFREQGDWWLCPACFYVKVVGAELLVGGESEESPLLWMTVPGPKGAQPRELRAEAKKTSAQGQRQPPPTLRPTFREYCLMLTGWWSGSDRAVLSFHTF